MRSAREKYLFHVFISGWDIFAMGRIQTRRIAHIHNCNNVAQCSHDLNQSDHIVSHKYNYDRKFLRIGQEKRMRNEDLGSYSLEARVKRECPDSAYHSNKECRDARRAYKLKEVNKKGIALYGTFTSASDLRLTRPPSLRTKVARPRSLRHCKSSNMQTATLAQS